MQELDKPAFDLMVFSGVSKIPYGENVKEFYINDFKKTPQAWDRFFKEGTWDSLNEDTKKEREALIEQALAKFDIKRKTFDL